MIPGDLDFRLNEQQVGKDYTMMGK